MPGRPSLESSISSPTFARAPSGLMQKPSCLVPYLQLSPAAELVLDCLDLIRPGATRLSLQCALVISQDAAASELPNTVSDPAAAEPESLEPAVLAGAAAGPGYGGASIGPAADRCIVATFGTIAPPLDLVRRCSSKNSFSQPMRSAVRRCWASQRIRSSSRNWLSSCIPLLSR